jgi:hypothetical protein
MRVPERLGELCGLLLDGGLPRRVPLGMVAAAERGRVLSVLAGREGARGALGEEAYRGFLAEAAVGALRLREFREIVGAMGELGISVIPLKGMAYGLMFEAGGPLRAMADIDLLVKEEDYLGAGEVMVSLGYHEEFPDPLSHLPGHHERQFVKDGRLVEVHRYFLRGRRISVDYDGVWGRALELQSDGVLCLRLSAEDTLLYHCFHMGMHEFAIGGLMSVWELRRLILEDRPDLRACEERARGWGTEKITWCAFRLLECCFHENLRFHSPSLPFRIALERLVIEPSLPLLLSPGLLPRPVQLLRKGLLVDSPLRAASYLSWYLKNR